MQPQFTALLSLARGTSVVVETLFESRTRHIQDLSRMGANILLLENSTSVIQGVKKLKGTTVDSKDLRGGAALILAGLAAQGETIITNSQYVERGYEQIDKQLQELGANIKYVQ